MSGGHLTDLNGVMWIYRRDKRVQKCWLIRPTFLVEATDLMGQVLTLKRQEKGRSKHKALSLRTRLNINTKRGSLSYYHYCAYVPYYIRMTLLYTLHYGKTHSDRTPRNTRGKRHLAHIRCPQGHAGCSSMDI